VNYAYIKLVYSNFVIKQQLRTNYQLESVKHLPQLREWPSPPAHFYLEPGAFFRTVIFYSLMKCYIAILTTNERS
jgi:hypothetical protein